ncbi:putative redox protein, regulator of disulfide bond formation [Hoeflea sp. IMCC20628]|uniref:sulfurtransferase TusA family protein n=1 Tax=Hoeflea sp. IMCC20628 TaxID=1620421 RepID=UPI00063AD45E|nr:sulfurtransferase TusA family protein [Hoeflea sp. IMCC20628]AKI03205.1 putative redox protein, regulator of disulfide bond formation [Hoeflea sp. IMCC20628]
MSDGDTLDLRGLKCPLPVLRLRKHLRDLASGAKIRIETTDPLAVIDIPHFCQEAGHPLISNEAVDGGHAFVIEKA